MKRAWRLRALGGRYYAEYTVDDGETWVPTPPGGLGSATAAAQLVVEMKRKDEGEGGLTDEEKRALMEKFSERDSELHDDMYNEDAERELRRLEWGKWLVDQGIVSDGEWPEGESDEGHLPSDLAS